MLKTKDLCAGYGKKVVISGVSFEVKAGEIVTLIGPNGSGKSTVLKTITGQLARLGGTISVLDKDLVSLSASEAALHVSMVMTERIHPEYMTCRDVIATGRYPYTGRLGILGEADWRAVDEAIKLVHAEDVVDSDFMRISDGQRQRVMLARAICQDTEIIVLDEPTSFLDMFYKLDLLKTIRFLAREKGKAILMSLHELDLVKMVADTVVCLKNDGVDGAHVVRIGTPGEIFVGRFVQDLYGVEPDEFDPETASLRLKPVVAEAVGGEGDVQKVSGAPAPVSSDAPVTKKRAKVIMVQGTMSNAGKSLLVAGLCRVFRQDGYRVAPFKSQNMALNSFITNEGLEMGRAQVMQAEAAGIEPIVAMNPILLKPTDDKGSQVIVNGEVIGNMRAKDYFKYKKQLIPDIKKAFSALEEIADIIVIEGAGSPAEINLRSDDIVNMGLAELVDAPVLLVADIDRGGVFAQLCGTVQLLRDDERARVKGLVINKFRGDKSILDPGISMIEDMLKIPVTGVLPYLDISLDDEDSLSTRFEKKETKLVNIGVVRLPRISNFTDFAVFEQIQDVSLHYITDVREVAKMDMVIIPGSKNTIGDLKWLRESGLEAAIKKFATKKPVFGICGGYQMLGNSIIDADGVEGGGELRGMELLDCRTELKSQKVRTRVSGRLGAVDGVLSCLSRKEFSGYEIHMGETTVGGNAHLMEKGAYSGNVYGTYIHGFFDEGDLSICVVRALAAAKGVSLPCDGAGAETDGAVTGAAVETGAASCEKLKERSGDVSSGSEPRQRFDYRAFKETQYDKLADAVRGYMDMKAVYGMLREAAF
ncbi:MAG: cobyric acid synthase [Treponemataceae bacterium]|nr:cobyric acid synthase [Treponemataceae bacterium]